MKHIEERSGRYALCTEMLETPGVIRGFDELRAVSIGIDSDMILLSGEGSSRIFPAKNIIAKARRHGWPQQIMTESASQSIEYKLSGAQVFVASNSGKTAEGVRLIRHLVKARSADSASAVASITGLVAHEDSPIARESDRCFVLGCGGERAVAATKSVVEQALFYETLLRREAGAPDIDRPALSAAFEKALTMPIEEQIIRRAAGASCLYFAGRNDGVAEELTLKTNEITRLPSAFLEGTYAVHGVEEVMDRRECIVLIDPFPEEEEKFETVLRKGVGLEVIAIASRKTRFPTIRVPEFGDAETYVQLAAGWNLLVEIGLQLGVDLDTPQRARKVGNEYTGG